MLFVTVCLIWAPDSAPPVRTPCRRKTRKDEHMAWLRSWLKRGLTRLETYIFSLRTKRKRARGRLHASTRGRTINLARLTCLATILRSTDVTTARHTTFDTDSREIYIDNCATSSITNNPNDCATPPTPVNRTINGVTGLFNTEIYSTTIKWKFEDDDGVADYHVIPNSFYIPKATNCLLSPQQWARYQKRASPLKRPKCTTYQDAIILKWANGTKTKTVPLETRGDNVAKIRTAPSYESFSAFCATAGRSDPSLDDSSPLTVCANLIEDEDDSVDGSDMDDEHTEQYFPVRSEPTKLAFPMDGPLGTSHVVPDDQQLDQDGAELLRIHHKYGHAPFPKLQVLAKQGQLPTRLAKCPIPLCTACLYGRATKRAWRSKPPSQSQLVDIKRPGQCISVDQLVSSTPGLIAQLRGTPTTKRYAAATVFVDHYSRLGYICVQKTTSAAETIESKRQFEAYAASCGVTIEHYHADNGVFADNKFRESVAAMNQTLSFCGVNAHFQNGIAEKRIRDLQDSARTMLIHANRRWPDAVDTHLWPYALRYASDMINVTPMRRNQDRTPSELFTGSKVAFNPRHAHTFGCPAYVLDNAMQTGKKGNKWEERARVGIFLGYSPQHSRSVSLILSLTSGLVSPQFHVKFDDNYQTIKASFGDSPPKSHWQAICGFRGAVEGGRPTSPDSTNQGTTTVQEGAASTQSAPTDDTETTAAAASGESQTTDATSPEPPAGANDIRRSPRAPKPTERYLSYMEQVSPTFVAYEATQYLALDPSGHSHPLILHKTVSDPDTMYWHEAMQQPDREEFRKAALKEVEDHTKNQLWELIHKRKVPQGALIAPAVWSMKRKRRVTTGEVYRWKARLAYDGSKQTHGKNYWQTYAPVAQWPIVRFILTHALINRWKFCQVDYELAYTQADPETEMFMKIPKGFEVEGTPPNEYVLRIKKNYYGQKQAGRVWNKHLDAQLNRAGFRRSAHDECLYYRGSAIYVLYVDDSIITAPTQDAIDDSISAMKAVDLKLTYEPGLGDFLGVNIRYNEDGTIFLSQPKLTESIVSDLRLTEATSKKLPAVSTRILRRHLEEPPFDEHFHYRAVIGKLNYLEKSTRPDIAYAVHQCARFSADPRESHGKAVKHIGRYLRGTIDKGLMLTPDTSKGFDVYSDSDFAGNFHKDDAPADADTARSRTGYVIMYAGCPIYWQSTLQTEICLSTTEAEVVCLSMALRATIPLMHIANEMKARGIRVHSPKPTVHCRLFEDNSGAIELATNYKVRPRTKYMNVKWFHFRHHYESGAIDILPIRSEDQCADIFTKPLPVDLFVKHRKYIMCW